MVLQSKFCENCGEKYINYEDEVWKWCKPCQIDNLKGNFINWTSGNEKIDGFIQEMQLKIDKFNDIIRRLNDAIICVDFSNVCNTRKTTPKKNKKKCKHMILCNSRLKT